MAPRLNQHVSFDKRDFMTGYKFNAIHRNSAKNQEIIGGLVHNPLNWSSLKSGGAVDIKQIQI